MPNLRIKANPPDSAYVKVYPNYLSVGMHIFSPVIHVNISPAKYTDAPVSPSSKFRTSISNVVGFSASYRYVAAGFAFLTNSGMHLRDGYTPSRYRTATIKYSGRAFNFQFKYIRIRGFTDVQQHMTINGDYILRPDLVTKEFQFEGLWNFNWRRYSYVAPINFSQRQVKSHGSFLLKTGVYYQQLFGDTAILRPQQQLYYEKFGNARALRMTSIRLAPGIGANLVFLRKVYLSTVTFTSFDLCFYKSLESLDARVKSRPDVVFYLDHKFGIGYHSTRFYAGLRYDVEARSGVLDDTDISQIYQYVGVELGYRFNAPIPLKKFYKKTMPPGM
ncbi:DUF4421 family protein [Pseudochryseolinea flava]|nr:DUF4421 family protein [Pseudochryseolinea flava]